MLSDVCTLGQGGDCKYVPEIPEKLADCNLAFKLIQRMKPSVQDVERTLHLVRRDRERDRERGHRKLHRREKKETLDLMHYLLQNSICHRDFILLSDWCICRSVSPDVCSLSILLAVMLYFCVIFFPFLFVSSLSGSVGILVM